MSTTATEMLRGSYKSEALAVHTLFSFYTGDYEAYIRYSELQNNELAKIFTANKIPCSGQEHIRFTNAAVASEFLKNYSFSRKIMEKQGFTLQCMGKMPERTISQPKAV